LRIQVSQYLTGYCIKENRKRENNNPKTWDTGIPLSFNGLRWDMAGLPPRYGPTTAVAALAGFPGPRETAGEVAASPRGEKDIGARSSRTSSPLTCSSLPRSRAGHDPSGAATAGSDWTGLRRRSGRSPGQPVTQVPADLDCNRKGAPSPPRSNGQAFDEARNPVTVAGRRRYKASVPAHPCWDQAVPSCSPLTGWAPGPVAASRPSGAAASSYLTEGGRVPLGSVDWQ